MEIQVEVMDVFGGFGCGFVIGFGEQELVESVDCGLMRVVVGEDGFIDNIVLGLDVMDFSADLYCCTATVLCGETLPL